MTAASAAPAAIATIAVMKRGDISEPFSASEEAGVTLVSGGSEDCVSELSISDEGAASEEVSSDEVSIGDSSDEVSETELICSEEETFDSGASEEGI